MVHVTESVIAMMEWNRMIDITLREINPPVACLAGVGFQCSVFQVFACSAVELLSCSS